MSLCLSRGCDLELEPGAGVPEHIQAAVVLSLSPTLKLTSASCWLFWFCFLFPLL